MKLVQQFGQLNTVTMVTFVSIFVTMDMQPLHSLYDHLFTILHTVLLRH